MTSSMGYKMAPKMDYDALLQGADGGAAGFKDVHTGFTRYATSKLANIYFAAELDRRLQERGIHNIYCNSCHPGEGGEGPNRRGRAWNCSNPSNLNRHFDHHWSWSRREASLRPHDPASDEKRTLAFHQFDPRYGPDPGVLGGQPGDCRTIRSRGVLATNLVLAAAIHGLYQGQAHRARGGRAGAEEAVVIQREGSCGRLWMNAVLWFVLPVWRGFREAGWCWRTVHTYNGGQRWG